MEDLDSYNGAYTSTEIKSLSTLKTKKSRQKISSINNVAVQPSTNSDATESQHSTVLPELAMCHPEPIPLPKKKYNDLQVLKRLCRQESQEFFNGLPYILGGAADWRNSKMRITYKDHGNYNFGGWYTEGEVSSSNNGGEDELWPRRRVTPPASASPLTSLSAL